MVQRRDLLLSLKIIWMIHPQMKLHPFQFWIFNSLDFQVNDLSRRIHVLEGPTADASGTSALVAPRKRRVKPGGRGPQGRATSRTSSPTDGSEPV